MLEGDAAVPLKHSPLRQQPGGGRAHLLVDFPTFVIPQQCSYLPST